MARSLAGTRRGSERCGGCGHTRLRHLSDGYGECTDFHYEAGQACDGRPIVTHTRCTCRAFATQATLERI